MKLDMMGAVASVLSSSLVPILDQRTGVLVLPCRKERVFLDLFMRSKIFDLGL